MEMLSSLSLGSCRLLQLPLQEVSGPSPRLYWLLVRLLQRLVRVLRSSRSHLTASMPSWTASSCCRIFTSTERR